MMHNPFKVADSKFKARVERHHEYTNADGVLSFDEFKQLYNVLVGAGPGHLRPGAVPSGVLKWLIQFKKEQAGTRHSFDAVDHRRATRHEPPRRKRGRLAKHLELRIEVNETSTACVPRCALRTSRPRSSAPPTWWTLRATELRGVRTRRSPSPRPQVRFIQSHALVSHAWGNSSWSYDPGIHLGHVGGGVAGHLRHQPEGGPCHD